MKCLSCGKDFEPDRKTHKCCSEKCQIKYYNQNHKNPISKKEWEKKQRDSLSDWWIRKCILIESKGKIKTDQITPEIFKIKKEQLIIWRKKQANRKAYLEANPPVPKEKRRVCIVCKGIYEVKGKSPFCGDKCRNVDSLNKYYANHDVILANGRAKYWEGKEERKPFECKECGKIVVSKYKNRRNKFCSIKCGKKYMHRERGGTHKRRAEHFGSNYENVNPLKVFMRDGWRCQLCKRKLKSKDRGSFKDSAPELDHIIPLSKGGAHSYQNTQCVCRKCNSEKGNNEVGQLRLFA